MSTSETSTPKLEDKISVLSFLPQVHYKWAEKFCDIWDMSIPLAVGVQLEWITELSDKGVEVIDECFSSLAELFGYDDQQELITYILSNPEFDVDEDGEESGIIMVDEDGNES